MNVDPQPIELHVSGGDKTRFESFQESQRAAPPPRVEGAPLPESPEGQSALPSAPSDPLPPPEPGPHAAAEGTSVAERTEINIDKEEAADDAQAKHKAEAPVSILSEHTDNPPHESPFEYPFNPEPYRTGGIYDIPGFGKVKGRKAAVAAMEKVAGSRGK